MSEYATIRTETNARGVAHLTLSRGQKHNALDRTMIDELTDATARLAADPSVRVVVLAADGPSFCAGADLAWMEAQFAGDRASRIAEVMALARMLKALNELPKPLIGCIQGPAYGGGIGLIAVCDVAIAADAARFALTETRLGIIPATISPYIHARMGEAARCVVLSGRPFDVSEAVALGLLSACVPPHALAEAVEAEAAACLSAVPVAVADAKALLRSLSPPVDEAVMLRTANLLADAWERPEAQAAIGAFLKARRDRAARPAAG